MTDTFYSSKQTASAAVIIGLHQDGQKSLMAPADDVNHWRGPRWKSSSLSSSHVLAIFDHKSISTFGVFVIFDSMQLTFVIHELGIYMKSALHISCSTKQYKIMVLLERRPIIEMAKCTKIVIGNIQGNDNIVWKNLQILKLKDRNQKM